MVEEEMDIEDVARWLLCSQPKVVQCQECGCELTRNSKVDSNLNITVIVKPCYVCVSDAVLNRDIARGDVLVDARKEDG